MTYFFVEFKHAVMCVYFIIKDKHGIFDSVSDSLEKQLRRQVAKISDSQLFDRYSNTDNEKIIAIIEEELRKRGLF